MYFVWAPDNEWDYIANLTGDASWGHQEMRRHFMDIENCTYVPYGTSGHGTDGYLESSMMEPLITSGITSPNVARFVITVINETEGISPRDLNHTAQLLRRDINRIDTKRYKTPLNFMLPLTISPTTGARSSVAYYINDVVRGGHPLTISTHSLATKVITEKFDGKPKAVGVEHMVDEGLYSADGRYNASQRAERRAVRGKEIMVSGCTFNTPQILQLSGLSRGKLRCRRRC